MSADASIDLELNAKQLYSELQTAEQKYTKGMERIGQSTGRAVVAMDGLTVKTKAAGRQIHNFAQDMASGADSATLLQDAMMGVGKSLGLSLGALAGLGIGAVAVMKIGEIRKEAEALDKEIDKLTAPRAKADFQSLTDLESHLTKAAAALENLKEQQAESKGFFNLQSLKDMFTGGMKTSEDKRAQQIADLGDSTDSDRGNMARKFQTRMGNREDALGGEPDFISKAKGLQAAANEKSHATQEAVVELMQELEMSFRELAKSVAEKRRERVQQTLGEIAATPEVATNDMSYDRWQAGQLARQAQGWDAEGERRRQAGDMNGAQEANNYSNDLKRSIPNLKDSEKDLKGEFKGALEEANILKEIRDKLSFKSGGG